MTTVALDTAVSLQCGVCRRMETLMPWLEVAETHGGAGERYRYVRCQACDAAMLMPRPKDLGVAFFDRMHEERAEARHRPLGRLLQQGVVWDRRKAVRRIAHPPGTLLDVGCGTGEFLIGMARDGWDVYGTERSSYAASIAREALGHHRVVLGGLDHLAHRRFDVITLWHVLEHAEDPHALLESAVARLAPGGLLIIEVPNAESLALKCSGPNYYLHMVPEHLFYWSERSLTWFGTQHGLTVCRVAYVQWFHLALSRSLANVAGLRWGSPARLMVMGLTSPWSVLHTYTGAWTKTTEAIRIFFRCRQST